MLPLVLFTLAVGLLAILYYRAEQKVKGFPPGPPRLPLIGSALSIPGTYIHLVAQEWRKKYGPMVGLLIARQPAVVVCGAEETFEVLKHEHIQARPDSFFTKHRSFGKKRGVFFSDGSFWSEQRRFTLKNLRDVGFGKTCMEGVIVDEADFICKQLRENGRTDPTQLFTAGMVNVLMTLVSGRPYARENPEFQQLSTIIERFMRNKTGSRNPVDMFPFLRFIAPEWSGYNAVYKPIHDMYTFFRKEVNTVREQGAHSDTLIARYVQETDRAKKAGEDTTFTDEGLLTLILDLFVAGSESTSNTLAFAVLYLVLHPEVQAKVHAELDSVVGRGQTPGLEDRARLPYLEAVMAEVMRINPIAPITPPHVASRDVFVAGYKFPQGTWFIPILWSVLHDKKHWGDPENFRPERFLDAQGNFVNDPYTPYFGVGKRYCLGEPLVRQTLFLFLATVMSRFQFSIPPGHPKPSTLAEPGFTTAPKRFTVLAKERVA